MCSLFWISAVGVIVGVPLHVLSVEHTKLRQRHGPVAGNRLGETRGRVSGYLMLLSLVGMWLAPQPPWGVPALGARLFLFAALAAAGAVLLYQAVSGLSIAVSEAHRPEQVVTAGIYARIRHPQYLGYMLLHVGFSVLLTAGYALAATPAVFGLLYAMARKEEQDPSWPVAR